MIVTSLYKLLGKNGGFEIHISFQSLVNSHLGYT